MPLIEVDTMSQINIMPPRSPHLTPLDFCLWEHLESVAYSTRRHTIDDRKNEVRSECAIIDVSMFNKVQRNLHTGQ